jgi:acylphosphatase
MVQRVEREPITPPGRISRVLALGVLAYAAVVGCSSDSEKAGEFTITGTVRNTDDGRVEVDVTEVTSTDYTSERLIHVAQYVEVQDGYVWDGESCESHPTGHVQDALDNPIPETELIAGQQVQVEGFVHQHVDNCGVDQAVYSSNSFIYETIQVLPS